MAGEYDFDWLHSPAPTAAAPAPNDFIPAAGAQLPEVEQPKPYTFSEGFEFLQPAAVAPEPKTIAGEVLQYGQDTFNTVMSGFAAIPEKAGWIGENTLGQIFEGDDMIESTFRGLKEIGGESASWWRDNLSAEYKRDMEAPVIVEDPTSWSGYAIGDDWNWNTVVANAVASAPEMMLTAGSSVYGAMLGKAAVKIGTKQMARMAAAGGKRAGRVMTYLQGAAPAIGGGLAGGAAEGLLAGAAAAVAVEEDIGRRDHLQLLSDSQRYRDIYGAADGMPEAERREYARSTLAREAGRSTFVDVGIATGVLGAPTGALFGKMGAAALTKGALDAVEGVSGTIAGNIAKGVGAEAVQEFGQEGSDQFLQNINLREYADPSKDVWQGVLNAAVTGGLVGGLLGGGTAAVMGPDPNKGAKAPKPAPVDPKVGGRINALLASIEDKGADPLELAKILRWSGNFGVRGAAGGRTAVEFARALEILDATGKAPPSIEEAVGGDVGPDGLLTEQAFGKDRRAYTFEVAATFTPADDAQRSLLIQTLEAENATPYAMGDGSLVVPASAAGVDSLRMLAQTIEVATGALSTVAPLEEIRNEEDGNDEAAVNEAGGEQGPEGAGGAEGPGQPAVDGPARAVGGAPQGVGRVRSAAEAEAVGGPAQEAAGRPVTTPSNKESSNEEGPTTEGPAEPGQGSPAAAPREEVSPRASRVAEQLSAEGIAVPVRGDGTVEITPDMDEATAERAVDIAANDGATSRQNDFREPSQPEIDNGTYRKGKTLFRSAAGNLRVVIENARGSLRRSKPGRPKWSRKMKSQYGYIPGTRAPDGDPVDVYVGPKAHDDTLPVYVVGQLDEKTGEYDEPKVMLGFRTQGEAKDAYLREYPQGMGEKLLGSMTEMTRAEFLAWTKAGDTDAPLNPISRMPMLSQRRDSTVTYGIAAGFQLSDHESALNDIAAKFDARFVANDDGDIDITVRPGRAQDVARALRRLEGAYDVRVNGERAASTDAGGSEGGDREGRQADAGEGAPGRGAGPERSAVFTGQGTDYAPLIARPKGTPHYSGKRRRAGAVSVVAVHYSPTAGKHTLDPGSVGASSGAERKRFGIFGANRKPTGVARRKYFYVQTDPDTLPRKEAGVVGTHPYRVQLDNLYDALNDPLGIWAGLVADGNGNLTAFEEAISELGYDGLVTEAQAGMSAPLAIVFDVPGMIPVAPVSAAETATAELLAEVGPDPNNEELNAGWSALTFERRVEVTNAVLRENAAEIRAITGTDAAAVGVGGYLDGVNPNVRIELPAGMSAADRTLAAAAFGAALEQDSVILIEPEGASPVGAVAIDIIGSATREEIAGIYRHLRDRLGDDIGGFTYYDSGLHILNFGDTPTDALALQITAELANLPDTDFELEIHAEEVSATFIGKDDYEGHLQGATQEQREAASRLQRASAEAVEAAAAEAGSGIVFSLSRAEVDELIAGLPRIPETIPDNDAIWLRIPGKETVNIESPEREALRDRIVDSHFEGRTPAPDGERVAVLMGGGGASGKGTLLEQLIEKGIVDASNAVHVDPDDIKLGNADRGVIGIPEFHEIVNRGDGRAAGIVHRESSKLAWRVADRAIEGGYNVILDRTLSDPDEALAEIAKLKANGYRVILYGVTVDPSEALERAVARAQRINRWVPFESLLWAHRGFNAGWEALAAAVDEGHLFETGSVTGGGQVEIASAFEGDLQTLRQDLYDAVEDRRTYGQEGSEEAEQAARADELQRGRREQGDQEAAREGEQEQAPGADPLAGGEVNPLAALMAEATERRARRKAETERLVAGAGDAGSVMFARGSDQAAIAGPDMSEPGKFRVTRIDDQGPVGHTVFNTMAEAVESALQEGYAPTDAPVFSIAPTFYSALTRAIEGAKGAPKKGDAKAWRGWLDGAQRRGEFKGSERDWLGIDDWLAEQGTVTREELLAFVQANEVLVEETVLGKGSPADHQLKMDAVENNLREAIGRRRQVTEDDDAAIAAFLAGDMQDTDLAREIGLPLEVIGDSLEFADNSYESGVKYDQYTVPGGSNYRELLLTLPGESFASMESRTAAERAWEMIAMQDGFPATAATAEQVRWARDIGDAGMFREWNDASRNRSREQARGRGRGDFISPHWDPHNIVTHVRFDERTDADGKRVLFLHEIQSDWHQQGRKHGYGPRDVERNNHRSMRVAQVSSAQQYTDRNGRTYSWAVFDGNQMVDGTYHTEAEAIERMDEMSPPTRTERVEGVPDAPFKQTDEWAMLAFKRMVRWAAENGFDRVTWATGEQAADLYDLSKRIDSIHYVVNPDGTYDISAMRDNAEVFGENRVTPERVADIVGKDIAERIVNGDPQGVMGNGRKFGVLEGIDLKVGGEGMRAFYDKLVPSAVGKWAKRFGASVGRARVPSRDTGDTGVRGRDHPFVVESKIGTDAVTVVRRETGERVDFANRDLATAYIGDQLALEDAPTVHALDITPAMRDAALQGLPMFRLTGASTLGLTAARVRAHVNKITAAWKGGPKVIVLDSIERAPQHVLLAVRRKGVENVIEGFFDPHTGAAYIVAGNVRDTAAIERVLFEETLGHYGLRAAFGGDFNKLLDQIVAAMKDSAQFKQLSAEYAKAYADDTPLQFNRRIADELLSKVSPEAEPGIWDMLVAWVREWLRGHGFVRQWTDNDILNLMERVHDGVRTGRTPTSLKRLASSLPEMDHDTGEVTTRTPAYSVRHLRDGEIAISFGDGREVLGAAALFEGDTVMTVDGDVTEENLTALARFAAESGAIGLQLGQHPDLDTLIESADAFAGLDNGVAYFTPEFIRSAIAQRTPMFSLRHRAFADAATEATLAKTVAPSWSDMTFGAKIQSLIAEVRASFTDGGLALKAGWIDSAAAIEELERNAFGGNLLDAADSAYKFISFTRNLPSVLAGVMQAGVPVYRDGAFQKQAGRKGLYDILRPLYDTDDGENLVYLWEGYAVARRSKQLIEQKNPDGTSKEKLLDREEIARLLALEEKYPVFAKVFDDWQAFNRQLLDLAVDRGAMAKDEAELWKANDYVPFYRADESTDEKIKANAGPGTKRGLSGQKVSSKRLHGSDQRIQPVLENMVLNTAAVLDRVYKNEAMNRIVAIAESAGAMQEVPLASEAIKVSNEDIAKALDRMGLPTLVDMSDEQRERWTTFFRRVQPIGNNIVSVSIEGKLKYYEVTDPLVLRAISDLGETNFGHLIEFMRGAKNTLTTMVTSDPGFMVANWLRDTLSSFVTSGANFIPLATAVEDSIAIWTQSGLAEDMMLAGGVGGGFYDPQRDIRAIMERQKPAGSILLDTPRKLWEAYRKIGLVSEQMNRHAIARAVLAKGGSLAEATYQAQDILNFTQRGDFTAARLLMRTVPFLNARIQGLYRLYKGATGRDSDNPGKARMAFLLKSSLVAAASMLLALKNYDDERYEKLPDHQKDTYWHIFIGDSHYAIPKPFEVGVLAATIPERVMRAIGGADSGKTFRGALYRAVSETFAMNPVPQAFKPLLESVTNYSFFTGRPVVDGGLAGLEAEAQYNPWTSETARAVADLMPDFLPDAMRSPVRIEHMVRGYLGTLGLYMLQMGDAGLRGVGAFPEGPDARMTGIPIIDSPASRFVRGDPAVSSQNKYADDLYEALGRADAAYRTVNAYMKQGRHAEARALMEERGGLLGLRSALGSYRSVLRDLNTQSRMVMMSDWMDGAQKRQALDDINRRRNELLQQARPLLSMVE